MRNDEICILLKREQEKIDLDLSDDEELKEAMNVHAIVSPMVPGATEECINADDVIDEIDIIFKVCTLPSELVRHCTKLVTSKCFFLQNNKLFSSRQTGERVL